MKYQIYNLKSKTIIIRTIIIITWVLIIFSFLFLPNFYNLNSHKNINVLAWAGMYDLSYINKFEKETGIKVHFSYYESNEELLVKLRATKGQGYDLVIPSDYAVYTLRKENLLKKLDKNKLDFLNNLNPVLLGHYFDKKNRYTIPAEWAVFGLGIDKNFFKNPEKLPQSWSLIFDNNIINSLGYKIAMANDPLVAIPIAALYLFGNLDHLTAQKLENVKRLMIKTKKNIEAYAEFRPDYYLITKNAQVAVASSAYIFRAMHNYKDIDFIIPKEGTLITIENFAIIAKTNKDDLIYKLINFLMRPETIKHHFENEQALLPVTTNVIEQLELKDTIKKLLTIDKKSFKKFHFLRMDLLKEPINEEYLRELFIEVKA